MSIRNRLLLLVFAVWLPAAAGFGLLARSTYERESASARTRVDQLAQSLSLVVERELDKRAVLAQALASSTAVRDGEYRRFHADAEAATRGSQSWAVLADRTRQIVNTRLPFSPGMSIPRVSGATLVDGAPKVFFSPRGPVVDTPVLSVYAAAPSAVEPPLNVGVAFDPSVVQGIVEQHVRPGESLVAIIDDQRRVMARSRDPDKWLGVAATGDMRSRAERGEAGFAESVTLDGVPSLSYLSSPNRYGWNVVIAIPQTALAAAAQRVTLQAMTAAGVLLTISLGFALYGARRLGRPISALHESATALERDEVPPILRTGVREADEVSRVLHRAGVHSQEATRTLEQRVAESVQQARDAQAKLLDAQKHEAIGRLTGGIAHDFNNLLQTITTALHVLEHSVVDGPPKRVLHGALRASSRAAALIRQMLTFGRAQPLDPRPVSLDDLVLRSRELTGKAVGEKILLSAAIEPGLPCIFTDPNQLELALLNIVFNARDAMPDGGRIVLAARRARPDEEAEIGSAPLVCIEVSDDGPGMAADVQSRAFEPYFTTKPVGQGSGLGLPQARAFAKQSGGDIRLTSEPGRGTRVRLYLPATDQRPPAEAPVRTAPTPTPPLDILMVEDDLLVSSVVVPALEAEGHRVTWCGTADDALARLEASESYDVLFTDVVMPGRMNGMDLVAWCRTHRPELPAVVVSGYTAVRAEPVAAMLRKPYGVPELLQALQSANRRDVGAAEGR